MADFEFVSRYVMTSFNLLAFTQPQMVQGLPMNPPKGPLGNWIGVKRIMGNATLDITAEGSKPIYVTRKTDQLPHH